MSWIYGSSTTQVELVVKNLPANAGNVRDLGSVPGWGKSPGEGTGNPLQYPCLENPMDRGAWRATVHGCRKESGMIEHTHTGGNRALTQSLHLISEPPAARGMPVQSPACSLERMGLSFLTTFMPSFPPGFCHW